MRRQSAQLSEVARRVHQPNSEVVMPDAVREHARRERITGLHQPLREREATFGLGRSDGQLKDTGYPREC